MQLQRSVMATTAERGVQVRHVVTRAYCSVRLLICYIDMGTHCEGRLRRGKVDH